MDVRDVITKDVTVGGLKKGEHFKDMQRLSPKYTKSESVPIKGRVGNYGKLLGKEFSNFSKWKMDADSSGYKVKLVTRSKHNDYYQAIEDGTIIGFFNRNK